MNRSGRGPGNVASLPPPGGIVTSTQNVRTLSAPNSVRSANGLSLSLIQELRPPMRGINFECILLELKEEPRRTIDNQVVTSFVVADKTGSIFMTFWGDDIKYLRPGDIMRIMNADAKLYKGALQVATSKSGSYKKIGEDTFPFSELPKWSEYQWIVDPNHPQLLTPLTTQLQLMLEMNGGVPTPIGASTMQRNNSGAVAAVNPAFRGPNQRFGPNQGSSAGNMNRMGPGHGPPGGQSGFHMNNNNNDVKHMGPNGGGGGGGPGNGFNQHMLGNNNHNAANGNNAINNGQGHGGSIGPGHNGGRPPPQGGMFSQQGHGHHGMGPGGPNGHSLGQNNGGGGGRHSKHGKHGKAHRDLDAPDSYPSPRTGLANITDEFAREIRLVSQGSQGGIGLGVGSHMGGGQGGGGSGSSHVRKRPKVEME
ncbi:SOSS complex subunit B2 [Podila epigama]|nr:SOSS complex subunit B2 [Podila epigama]